MDDKRQKRPFRFERRDILKAITMVPATALISATSLIPEIGKAAPPQSEMAGAAGAYQPKVFNPHEWKTIRILSDLIIPADERSGSATEAGVPEFIDDWLDFHHDNLRVEIRGGLTWLDIECNRSFQHDFADCSTSQQEQILDRIAFPEKAAPEDASAVAFFNQLRDLVVSGFFTSRMGIHDLPYLGNEPQSEWNGCPSPALAKLGVLKPGSAS